MGRERGDDLGGQGQQLIARAGESRTRVPVLMMLLCAGLTALITVNGSVAALVPVVVLMAVRLRREPSQLLMPLAFAAHAGSPLVRRSRLKVGLPEMQQPMASFDALELGAVASTRMACALPADAVEQEAAYLAVLPTAVRYRVDSASLALLSADGTYVVSFLRAAQP